MGLGDFSKIQTSAFGEASSYNGPCAETSQSPLIFPSVWFSLKSESSPSLSHLHKVYVWLTLFF